MDKGEGQQELSEVVGGRDVAPSGAPQPKATARATVKKSGSGSTALKTKVVSTAAGEKATTVLQACPLYPSPSPRD